MNTYAELQAVFPEDFLDKSELTSMALSGCLLDSQKTLDLLDALKKAPLTAFETVRSVLLKVSRLDSETKPLEKLYDTLMQDLSNEEKSKLKSGNELQHHNVRTTIVAQKVELSQQRSNLTTAEREYTNLLDRWHDVLKAYLTRSLLNPQDLFPIEVHIYDQSSPYKDVFNPNPRGVIERSLSECHDYLGTEFCGHAHGESIDMQPATSLLYNLYLECSGLIHVADLWSAFHASLQRTLVATSVGETEKEKAEEEEEQILFLFETALAELKYLNLIKQSRSRIDSVTKLSWKGL